MKKILFVTISLVFCMPLQAQELTEAEVSELMTKAFLLNKDGKHQEALEGFLKVGQNTKRQRSEDEHQVYVLSQTMAAMCYEQLSQYRQGFEICEQLLKEKLTDKEKTDVQHLYVMNGYFVATSYMKSSNRCYADARVIFDKILPYADVDMRNRILPKIPLSWYFEGTVHQIQQQYEKALPCIEKAQQGFHELGETKNEIDAICQLGNIKNAMFDTLGALDEYQKAGALAQVAQYDTKLMSILKEQRRLSSLIGNSEIVFRVTMQIDSLVALTDDQKTKFEYYSYKGGEAKDQGNFNLAEHWYLMNEQYVQQLNDEYIGADKHLYYTNLRDLYTKAGRYDEALKYAELSKREVQRSEDFVVEGATIYYVPTQLLFQIALESLPMEDGTLLGDHYRFVRLSSAREVVRYKAGLAVDVNSQRTNAVLYGGLKYDLTVKAMEEESAKYDIAPLLVTRGDILRGDSIYRELPETKKEIDAIEKILKSQSLAVVSFTGIAGTEESFLNMNGNAPQMLHVATHGFYYTPDAAQKIDYLKGNTDAMTLSGLVMSGGNAAWLGKDLPKGVLGGILTAANIARLDLNGIQMAVLSACQTGQGKATPEGLFGLQRAFKKAGVKTLVMSLWNVSDVVTKEFMIRFYENLARNGWKKMKAFNDAKSYIRSKYTEPYYWAGFIMLD